MKFNTTDYRGCFRLVVWNFMCLLTAKESNRCMESDEIH